MAISGRLIDEIVAASRIPFQKRRREVLLELRAHLEDFVNAGRAGGHSEEEIERLLVERFGDPRQIAGQFAWVYRRERVAVCAGGFLMATAAVSLAIAATAIPVQAVLSGPGTPWRVVLASRHTGGMALDILASAASYLGLLSLERIFGRGGFFSRAFPMLAIVAASLVAVFVAAGLRPQFLLFGFANGALLRVIQFAVRHPALRLGAALASFALLGVVFFHPSRPALMASAPGWLIMGSAYYLMTYLAARVDRALLRSL